MKNEQAKLVVSELNKMTHLELIEDSRVEKRFINLYNSIHGNNRGELMYSKLKFDFLKILEEKKELKDCSKLSIYGVFMDCAVMGLDISQGNRPLVYFLSRNINIGTKEAAKWEKRMYMQLSPYGEIFTRMLAGQIKHADNPTVVYKGDIFKPICDEHGKRVIYEAKVPRQSDEPVACFLKITKMDGSVEYSWLLVEDLKRLKEYSEKNNSYYDKETKERVKGNANALYTSFNGHIDPGFFEAKTTKHAFDNYPKLKTGNYTELASQQPEIIDYGLDTEPESFDAGQPSVPAPVTEVNDEDEVF